MNALYVAESNRRATSPSSGHDPLSQDRISMALEEYAAAMEAGQPIPRDALLAAYADVAEELVGCLDSLDFIRQVAPQLNDGATPTEKNTFNATRPLAALGDFRIVREIGRGGMGVVYEAEQISLGRRVALKVLPFAAMLDKRQLQRFHNEARAAAALNHPGIVDIFSVGCERGVHYYAMQLIEGKTLTDLIHEFRNSIAESRRDSHALSHEPVPWESGNEPTTPFAAVVTDRARPSGETQRTAQAAVPTEGSSRPLDHFRTLADLGIQAAEALDHAHENGIVHRDIKPSNLMLDGDGHLWITDFGLARIEADAGMTMTGDLLGTLRYMSPEQALAKRVAVDHRADIYSLGVTLYELLTLRPAFTAADRQELLSQIAFKEPKAPRHINRSIPVDLETIVLKAMAKDPESRFNSARGLADDLRAFLDHRPIGARRVNWVGRFRCWSKRNPMVAGLSILTAALSIVVAVLAGAGYARKAHELVQLARASAEVITERDAARAAEENARRQRDAAVRSLYIAHMGIAQRDWDSGHVSRLQQLLEQEQFLPRQGQADLRGWEWYYMLSLDHRDVRTLGDGNLGSIAWSPDGRYLACVRLGNEGGIFILDAANGSQLHFIRDAQSGGPALSWSPDGHYIAASAKRGRLVIIYDSESWREQLSLETRGRSRPSTDYVHQIAWSPNSAQLATPGPDKTVSIWDVTTGKVVNKLGGHNKTEVHKVAWSPDGRFIAAAGGEQRSDWIMTWDAATGEQKQTFEAGNYVSSIAWSPDSSRLLSGGGTGTVHVWDHVNGQTLYSLSLPSTVSTVAWRHDGRRFVTGQRGGRIAVWDATNGQLLVQLQAQRGHGSMFVAWSPDGMRLATAAHGQIRIWDANKQPGPELLSTDGVEGIAFRPDDTLLAYGSVNHTIKILDASTGHEVRVLQGNEGLKLDRLRWNSDGRYLACGGIDGSIVVWDALSGKELKHWLHEGEPAPKSEELSQLVSVAWHSDGQRLASVSQNDSMVRIWDALTGKQVSSFDTGVPDHNGVAWSPDGERLAVGKSNGAAEIWDAAGWRKLHSIEAHRAGVHGLAWSPDGRFLATIGRMYDPSIRIWDTFTGRWTANIERLEGQAEMIVWSRDGRRIATAGHSGTQIWDVETGEPLFTMDARKGIAWSHDGMKIATIAEGNVKVYDASIGYRTASDKTYLDKRAVSLASKALTLARNGRDSEALENLSLANELAPENVTVLSREAWFLTTCLDERFRNPDRALELARKATKLSPESVMAWQVLGWAHYRKGEWQASIDALEKSCALQQGGDPWQWLFLAMAHSKLGHNDEAGRWHDQSVAWAKKEGRGGEEFDRFRSEAEKVLGIKTQR